MIDRSKLPLNEIAVKILKQMEDASFSPGTIGLYRGFFNRLNKLAHTMGKSVYDDELAQSFISDTAYKKDGGYCHSRYLYHVRCIRFIESFINNGIVDFSITQPLPPKELKSKEFRSCHSHFKTILEQEGLKPNTMNGYLRFVYYFLSYLEDKGYTSLIQPESVNFV